MSRRVRYAAVGTGARITMFIDPIVGRFREEAELVGLCDVSETRRTYHQQRLIRDQGASLVPTFGDFSEMLRQMKPDVVIVCTPDATHHEYIVESLEAGADVISEKPLTTDAAKCGEIFAAIERTGRRVRTAFNFRWSPGVDEVRRIIQEGTIGKVKHVDFEYALNTSHGADYFRRWHSQKEMSGGLLVHKSTHHFDLINWWIDGVPSVVFAMGDLVYYGRDNAILRGEEKRTTYPRYTGEADSIGDPFRLDLTQDAGMTELYHKAEGDSGYIRDKNVFREGITIEDSMSVLVRYRDGAMLTYSLNAFCPVEGFRVTINGDGGRIEYEERVTGRVVAQEIGTTDQPWRRLSVQKLFGESYEVPIVNLEGGHGGGDPLIQEQMFSASPPVDPLGRNAGHEQGAASLLVGAAANQSIASGLPVKIDDLLLLNPHAKKLSELI